MKKLLFLGFASGGLLTAVHCGFAQGSLTPPGAPAPTMKTLTQVEPRAPISSVPITITNAGSYYLTTNLTGAAGQAGINIATDNVTIDLNGFGLYGGASSGSGVVNGIARTNIVVRNGIISGWNGGGISCGLANNGCFEHLQVANNPGGGLSAGPGCVVQNCVAQANGGNGISSAFGITVKDCSAFTNSAGGISVGLGSLVVHCNSANSANGVGINVGAYSQVLNCVSDSNGGSGINIGFGSIVKGCMAAKNTGAGISAADDCRVVDNDCIANTFGISMSGNYSRIEGNNAVDNTSRGIVVGLGSGVLVIRNSVNGSGTNSYNIPVGNLVGPILSTPASILTNSNPHANFGY
jgi:Right handed beta helix region